jgi:hypothetical protein
MVARLAGAPNCGFYPGSDPGEHLSGTAATFEQARADFEIAWCVFSAKRTDADYRTWRDQRDHGAWKAAMWDAGLKLPTQTSNGSARCICGANITIGSTWHHVQTHHRLTV